MFPDMDWNTQLEDDNAGRNGELDGGDDAVEELCESFILLNRLSSNKFCRDFLCTLRKHKSHVSTFVSLSKNVEDIIEHKKRRAAVKMESDGFKKKELNFEGLSYSVYYKTPFHVLGKQISTTSSDELITRSIESEFFPSHERRDWHQFSAVG